MVYGNGRLTLNVTSISTMMGPVSGGQAKAERMFRHHGFKVLFVARLLVGLRSPVYFSAGCSGCRSGGFC